MNIQQMSREDYRNNHQNDTIWDEVVVHLLNNENISYHSIKRFPMGGNIVYAINDDLVLKLFSPFDREEFVIETEVLEKTDWSKISVEVPSIVKQGSVGKWHFLIMTRVSGELLIDVWEKLSLKEQLDIATDVGVLIKQMHTLPVENYPHLNQTYFEWISTQKKQVTTHHSKTGLAPHLVEHLENYVSTFVPSSQKVLLTGEYTPFNLLVNQADDRWRVTGLIDFADCFIGEPTYDLLGPILFNYYPTPKLTKNFLSAYGMALTDSSRTYLMQLLLLHRFSHIPNYLDGHIDMNEVLTLEELSSIFFSNQES